MNKELPINSTRFIKIELCGIKRFKTNPATKAPMMCSTPATSAKKAAKKTIDKTKIYCDDFSLSNLLKNHRATFGIKKNMINEKMVKDVINRNQNAPSKLPCAELVITARMIKTAVSVKMVPPIVIATALFFVSPNFDTIGYATNVCVANILAVNQLAV